MTEQEKHIPALGIVVVDYSAIVRMGRSSEVWIKVRPEGKNQSFTVVVEGSDSLEAWSQAVYNLFGRLGHRPTDVTTRRHSVEKLGNKDYIQIPFSDGKNHWKGQCEWSENVTFDEAYLWAVVNGFIYWLQVISTNHNVDPRQ